MARVPHTAGNARRGRDPRVRKRRVDWRSRRAGGGVARRFKEWASVSAAVPLPLPGLVLPPNHPLQPHATGACRRQLTENSMARMVVIYKAPKDPVAFDKHYVEVHVPLAK